MYTALTIFSYLFDILLLIFFFHIVFEGRNRCIPAIVWLAGFCVAEFLLYDIVKMTGSHNTLQFICSNFGSMFTTFLLTFYYNARFLQRILTAVTFHILASVSEIGIYALLCALIEDFENAHTLNGMMLNLFSSKLLLFLCIAIASPVFRFRRYEITIPYYLLILLTPLSTMLAIFSIILPNYNNRYLITPLSLSALFFLLLLNFADFFLLDKLVLVNSLQKKQQTLEQQIAFQTDKYKQISAAYRNTRRIIHDTKKHFFFIKECIKNNRTASIPEYLDTALLHLEQSYSQINTGSLVIDAFVNHYMMLSQNGQIHFSTDIHITPSAIPLTDYELCIIIGNLLDNSVQACQKMDAAFERKINLHIAFTENNFTIYIKNTMPHPCQPKKHMHTASSDTLDHGFGLTNIEQIVRSYAGVFTYYTEKGMFHAFVSIACTTSLLQPANDCSRCNHTTM